MQTNTLKNPLANDLDYILTQTLPLWENLRNQRILITGGTGFFGCWLLESFIWANEKLNLNAKAFVLTRDKQAFNRKWPRLAAQTCLQFWEGDVRDFAFPTGHFAYVIHAATDSHASLQGNNPLLALDTIITGTQQTLEFARLAQAKSFLLISSGAVYGKQSPTLSHIPEEYSCQPNLLHERSTYAVGKCTAEHLSCLYANQYNLDVKIARCFAFVGPYLPLDEHFAIGNFIRDGLKGKTITVNGDGTAYRSYLYAADLVIWLWTILFNGKTLQPYNVGSDEAVSIADLAQCVATLFNPHLAVHIAKAPAEQNHPERYVPDISRANQELGLVQKIHLNQALESTIKWYRT